ncbi:MAG: Fic family protein [Gammaproteobacteria bacterium]|nr:Fic family protein [Gammaproteobacteria bacterium]MDE0367989.1 Fic family protein [Gammaproteobacteria bacterium]
MSTKRKQAIYATLQAASTGLTMADLLASHPDIARRTAQRWITGWVKDGRIRALGKARARRYIPAARSEISRATSDLGLSGHASLGAENPEALLHVTGFSQSLTPAGYGLDFLEAYRPNETFYLAAPLRRQLWAMGDTGRTKLAAGTYAGAVLDRLSNDLSWASSRLEGNTYSRLEARELIEQGKAAEDKSRIETQMILNHRAAIELLVENADAAGFNRYTLLNLHGSLSENLLSDPEDEGRLREDDVNPGNGASLSKTMRRKLDEVLDIVLEKAAGVRDPFEQSFFAMTHLTLLRPFVDVNKRTARLIANLPLIRSNLCPLTFMGVLEADYNRAMLGLYETGHVEPLRDLYLLGYELSAREYRTGKRPLSEPDPVRLEYRDAIKQAVQDVVKYRDNDPAARIKRSLAAHFAEVNSIVPVELEAIVVAELERLHEGVLARYGLWPAQYALWRERWQRAGAP